jgi:RNA polymerase sigma-54 factor
MRLDTSQQMRLQQKLILAPRMIQSMEILQLPIMELQERIQQELQENPALEMNETRPDETPEEAPPVEDNPDREPELVVDADHDFQLDFDRLEALGKDWEEHLNTDHRPSRAGLDEEGDKKHDAMQNMPSRPQSLQDHLLDQVSLLDVSAELAELAKFLIANLDKNGQLTAPLESTFAAYGRPVTPEEAEAALKLVQKLEPAGVGARDMRECLLLQLTEDTPHRDVVRTLIEHHLEDIVHNRLPVIQRRTGFDLASIKVAIETLKHLDIQPGARFVSEHVPYVVPDIAVEPAENGEYQVRLLDDYLPNVYISRRSIELLKDKNQDPKTREYIKRKIQSAQWLLESIEQRRSTLEKVTKAIIRHQKAFLDHGPEHITPLKMQQIADQVHVHVTTVSRAVDDKWAQTPRGVFRLRDFFRHGTTTSEGEEVAWDIIKQKLLDIIGKEDKANPYSDEELVKKMDEVGYPVARRTVTKYRKLLKIPSSRQRKDWTISNGAPETHAAAAPTSPPPEPIVEPPVVMPEPPAHEVVQPNQPSAPTIG